MPLPTLDELSATDRAGLSSAWREIINAPPPPRMSQIFMRRVLAFEIQAQQHGGLPKALLKALAKSSDKKPTSANASPTLKPGGRLLREWNGVTHVVDIAEDGFDWNGQSYRSLSIIARTITGTHWSGPRFFGLNKGASK
ncbi:Protein of unknown function [Shimia gijangensis]|uniref:DUF2924 domain-containing protein n=1 Tax=Shimia gijangensis TaxID=1470563 RepID=A0A1M6QF81_9RHOB|nr:DUF2924 domain-containing protein [Shimia gijangensis]SHK18760.1 Protein of unknown function [Shimia gijangensis]